MDYMKKNEKNFMTRDTYFGFILTCSTALELTNFLIQKSNYKFVMLSRFNQDNIERFFGMLRGACGNGDHPDPALFLIIYRLMSTYSLIRAPEGSNVMGEEVLEALLQSSDYVENHDPKKEW